MKLYKSSGTKIAQITQSVPTQNFSSYSLENEPTSWTNPSRQFECGVVIIHKTNIDIELELKLDNHLIKEMILGDSIIARKVEIPNIKLATDQTLSAHCLTTGWTGYVNILLPYTCTIFGV